MDQTAIYRIPYGLYYLGTTANGKSNICVVNTVSQVTDEPKRVSVTVLKTNLTCELMLQSGTFSVSILDADSTLADIAHFGQQSGRNVDKLAEKAISFDVLGNPVYKENCAAVMSVHVTQTVDLGTHVMFIGELADASVESDKTPMTYAAYRAKKAGVKVEAEQSAPATYQCKICHYVYDGEIPFEELPDDYVCPVCKKPKSFFVKM